MRTPLCSAVENVIFDWLNVVRSLILLTTLFVYLAFKVPEPYYGGPVNCTTQSEPYDDDVHLVILLRGEKPIERAKYLFKSLFYHQGRLDLTEPKCASFIDHTFHCPNQTTPISVQLTMHILGNDESIAALKNLWSGWKLEQFDVQYYQIENYLKTYQYVRNLHGLGATPFLKILVGKILPTTISRALFVDTDTLFNANIREIWDLFKEFRGCQAIGMAWEHFPIWCTPVFNHPIPLYGINTGVMLMKLDILREISFEYRFNRMLNESLRITGYVNLGEQGVLNDVVNMWPEIYFKLPCAWNMQLFFETGEKCCPSTWPIRNPLETNCYPFSQDVVKLVHHNIGPKPDGSKSMRWRYPRNYTGHLTVPELRERFAEAYIFFKNIPDYCFK